MKIRKAIRMAVVGAALAMPAGAVLAAGSGVPITGGFGQWSINATGGITAASASTIGASSVSATPVTDAGFLQRNVTVGSRTFIQTIIAEGATGDTFDSFASGTGFGDENFVEIGGTGGLSDKAQVFESASGTVFTSQAGLNTGSFAPVATLADVKNEAFTGANTTITLGQKVTSGEFNTGFDYTEGVTTGTGTNSDVFAITDIRATANDSAASFASNFAYRNKAFEGALATDSATLALAYLKLDANTTLGDPEITQNFHLKERSGLGAVAAGTALATAGSGSGTVANFNAGDHIVNLQVGQEVTGAGVFGLNDFVDETLSAENGSDSQSNANVPFWTVTDTSTGGDPFATF